MVAFARDNAAEARGKPLLSYRGLILAIGVACAVLLALPGVTIATKSVDELFLVIDGVHRVLMGQIPSLDFHTTLGPLTYYGPAAGYALTGSFGAAMPLMMALFTACMTGLAAHVLASRLHPFLAVVFAAFLLLILAAPMNLGEAVTALSFSMFYNRIGWVALALLLLLYLTPRSAIRHQMLADAVCAAILTIMMIYLRLTYGFVALAFLLFMITDSRQRNWAALAVLLVATTVGVVELLWGGSSIYVRDVWREIQEAGVLGSAPQKVMQAGVAHLADLLLLALLASLALWRRWRLRDLAFFLFCSIAGVWLLSHNIQRWGVISIHAAAAVAAERLLREMEKPSEAGEGPFLNRSGVKLYFLAFMLPTILHCGMALVLHAGAATLRGGQAIEVPRMSNIRLTDLWTTGDFGGGQRYLSTVEEGLSLLKGRNEPLGRLAVAGSVDVFSAALGLSPSTTGLTDLRWQNIGDADIARPAQNLAGADTVIFRNPGDAPVGPAAEYLAYVRSNFSKVEESQHWMLFRRNLPDAGSK
ncbi:hypothetical protein REJC140_02139 [Pseudorhizobium endolithicum]|uniref:Transmembrane protein n=1 Tax=Pseudorhizobium endolithicum TaxID=1191678 RepID=A0ABM8PY01_9HYPH|nr:hypothetical protein [Pseudorhizobium endolithicum]CAD7054334.1 hypothetical protein REJC140_02139 [Pseudorhizobium endolithicum]